MWGLACFAFAPPPPRQVLETSVWQGGGQNVAQRCHPPALLQFSHSQSSNLWEPSCALLLCPGGEARPAAPLPSGPD